MRSEHSERTGRLEEGMMEQQMVSREEKLRVIRAYVERQRRILGVTSDQLSRGFDLENSCDGGGREWLDFVERGLVYTRDDSTYWQDVMEDSDTLGCVYRYITEGKRQ